MPQKTVSQGDTIRLFEGTPGNLYFLEADGNIRLAQTREFARLARVLPSGLDIEVTIRESGAVHAYGEEAATITYERQGISWQPRIAEGVIEVNKDQDTNIGANHNSTSDTSTVTANEGELWKLSGLEINIPGGEDLGQANEKLETTVQTQAEGVEISYARLDDSPTVGYDYQSDGWRATSGTLDESHGDPIRVIGDGIRIDSTNGIQVVCVAENMDHESTRNIRFVFEVLRA